MVAARFFDIVITTTSVDFEFAFAYNQIVCDVACLFWWVDYFWLWIAQFILSFISITKYCFQIIFFCPELEVDIKVECNVMIQPHTCLNASDGCSLAMWCCCQYCSFSFSAIFFINFVANLLQMEITSSDTSPKSKFLCSLIVKEVGMIVWKFWRWR